MVKYYWKSGGVNFINDVPITNTLDIYWHENIIYITVFEDKECTIPIGILSNKQHVVKGLNNTFINSIINEFHYKDKCTYTANIINYNNTISDSGLPNTLPNGFIYKTKCIKNDGKKQSTHKFKISIDANGLRSVKIKDNC